MYTAIRKWQKSRKIKQLVVSVAWITVAQACGCLGVNNDRGASTGGGIDNITPVPEIDAQPPQSLTPPGNIGESPLTQQPSKFPALDASEVGGFSETLVGFAALDGTISTSIAVSVLPRARPFECLDTPRAEDDTYMAQLYTCNGTLPQKFIFTEDGHIELVYRFSNDSPKLCLVGGDLSISAVTVAHCSADVLQLWQAGGHLLQHHKSKLCLSRHDGSLAPTKLALTKCRRDDVNQSWVVGDDETLAAIALRSNPSFPQAKKVFDLQSATTLVGYTAGNNDPVVATPTLLALRQGVDVCVGVDASATPPKARLYRCEEAPTVIFQPDGRIESFNVTAASLPVCILPGPGTATTNTLLSTAKCSTSPELKWRRVGHNLMHVSSGRCLSYDESLFDDASVALRACDANEVRQSWASGDLQSMRNQARKLQEGYDISTLCATQANVLVPATSTAETRWLIAHFGGSVESMRRAVEKGILNDCRSIYFSPSEVKPLPPIAVRFEQAVPDSGTPAWARFFPYPQFSFKSNPLSWSNRPQSFNLPEQLLHHEVAHLFDRRSLTGGVATDFGKTMLIEGYADWVAIKSGYYYEKKVKGGAWNDGYAKSAYFLLWLDENFAPFIPGQRFTERAKTQMYQRQMDPNWFDSWSRAETGSTIEQLWTRYQRSF